MLNVVIAFCQPWKKCYFLGKPWAKRNQVPDASPVELKLTFFCHCNFIHHNKPRKLLLYNWQNALPLCRGYFSLLSSDLYPSRNCWRRWATRQMLQMRWMEAVNLHPVMAWQGERKILLKLKRTIWRSRCHSRRSWRYRRSQELLNLEADLMN